MLEYTVHLKNGIAYVYAEGYVVSDNQYQFYREHAVVRRFPVENVLSVQQSAHFDLNGSKI